MKSFYFSLKYFFDLYFDRKMFIVLVLGFSGGLPLLLYSSTLAYWMSQEGIQLQTIGLFSLVAFPASFKFVWAPLIDRLPLPYITKRMGQRRGWLLVFQLLSSLCIYGMSLCGPRQGHMIWLAILSIILAFAAANQNTLILTYQVEGFDRKVYGASEAICVFGYRMGLLAAGALAFYLSVSWSWSTIYQCMALLSLVGCVATFFMKESAHTIDSNQIEFEKIKSRTLQTKYPQWMTLLNWLHGAVICPFKVFMNHKGWLISLVIILLYKVGDNMIGCMSNIFYKAQGYSPTDIANASKIFGMWSSIIGGIVGGYLISRMSIYKGLFYFGVIHSLSLFLFFIMAVNPKNLPLLYIASGIEHFTGGIHLTALFSYQMLLTDKRYAATQLALLTSFSHMGRAFFSTPSGYLIEHVGWEDFFLITALSSFIVLPFILFLGKYKKQWHKKVIRLAA